MRRGWLTESSPKFDDPILEHDDVRRLWRGELWLLDDSPVNLEVRHSRGGLWLKFYGRCIARLVVLERMPLLARVDVTARFKEAFLRTRNSTRGIGFLSSKG